MLGAGFILRLLRAWFVNAEKRIVKSSKKYLHDTGLLHRMCRISSFDDLFSHPVAGGSWEGYMVERVAQHKNHDLDTYYYRTRNGAGVRHCIAKGIVPAACIEVKINNVPHVTEGYFNCLKDLKTKKNYIITPRADAYPYYGVTVCSLRTFINNYLPAIQ